MMTLRQFAARPEFIPAATSWYLSDLGVALGKQELFTRQSPQRLKVLRESALIESAISSNRIEGVNVEGARVGTVLFGRSPLHDREEAEVRGYRDALRLIHDQTGGLPISEKTLRLLHRLARAGAGDAGEYKTKDTDIIEISPGGRSRVRFRTVPARETPAAMGELFKLWTACAAERWIHPLIALAALDLDFLCIHPFRDGNGRASRLLLLLGCYHDGLEVGRYVSLERLIEENKDRYYETLELSSRGWHQAKHDPWPYINHVLYILKTAYAEFENRVAQTAAPRGEKTVAVLHAIVQAGNLFTIEDIRRQAPAVSIDMIRNVLKSLRNQGKIACLGRGRSAQWRKSARWKPKTGD